MKQIDHNDLILFTDHFTAVTVSVKDKLTLSISVAVGSSIASWNTLFSIDIY
jgi:Ca2+/H+ antiporter